jgi:hypothetical protein
MKIFPRYLFPLSDCHFWYVDKLSTTDCIVWLRNINSILAKHPLGYLTVSYIHFHATNVSCFSLTHFQMFPAQQKTNWQQNITRRLVAVFPSRLPGFEPGSAHVGFVVDEVRLRQVFSEYFGFLYQSSFQQLPQNQHHLSSDVGYSDRSTKWTQSHPIKNNKKMHHNGHPLVHNWTT